MPQSHETLRMMKKDPVSFLLINILVNSHIERRNLERKISFSSTTSRTRCAADDTTTGRSESLEDSDGPDLQLDGRIGQIAR